jgi:hypothetical protein
VLVDLIEFAACAFLSSFLRFLRLRGHGLGLARPGGITARVGAGARFVRLFEYRAVCQGFFQGRPPTFVSWFRPPAPVPVN